MNEKSTLPLKKMIEYINCPFQDEDEDVFHLLSFGGKLAVKCYSHTQSVNLFVDLITLIQQDFMNEDDFETSKKYLDTFNKAIEELKHHEVIRENDYFLVVFTNYDF